MNLYRLFPPTKTDETPPPAIWFRKKIEATRTYNEMVRHVNGQPSNYSDPTVSLESVYTRWSPALVVEPILNNEEWITKVTLMFTHKVNEW